ncbi:MAG: hypothetical protein GY854_19650, partial [Deltaproteobacteria bacterium]|nr:hypothetical protein [Deltaproteobacteria bacterium]
MTSGLGCGARSRLGISGRIFFITCEWAFRPTCYCSTCQASAVAAVVGGAGGAKVVLPKSGAYRKLILEPGFLLRSRTMVGTTPDAHDVITARTRDEFGNLIREEHFGGDVQSVSTSTDLCGLPLPDNQYRIDHAYQYGSLRSSQYYDENGVAFRSLDLTIDQSTG